MSTKVDVENSWSYHRDMKKLTITAICILFLTFNLSAEKFKIGVILPLTGKLEDYGKSISNSIHLARSDYPDLFTNIEFIFEDAQHSSILTINSFRKLVNIDRVNMVYTFGVQPCKVLAPIAESTKVPLIGQCIDQESSRNRKHVIRFMNYTDEYLAVQMESLHKRNIRNIAVIITEHSYLDEMYRALIRNKYAEQKITLIDSVNLSELDFRAQVNKIKNGKYDAVGVFLFAGQISQFYKQMREQRFKIQTFGTNIFESLSERKLAKGAMKGAEYSYNAVRGDYISKYKKHFNNTSQIGFGALAYEFARLSGRLFNELGGSISTNQILEAFKGVKKEQGVSAGPYSFRDSEFAGKYFYFPVVMKVVS